MKNINEYTGIYLYYLFSNIIHWQSILLYYHELEAHIKNKIEF